MFLSTAPLTSSWVVARSILSVSGNAADSKNVINSWSVILQKYKTGVNIPHIIIITNYAKKGVTLVFLLLSIIKPAAMFNHFLITALIAFAPFLLSAQTIKPGPEKWMGFQRIAVTVGNLILNIALLKGSRVVCFLHIFSKNIS